jgi:hypothetical protein
VGTSFNNWYLEYYTCTKRFININVQLAKTKAVLLRHADAIGEMRHITYLFLISAVDGGDW